MSSAPRPRVPRHDGCCSGVDGAGFDPSPIAENQTRTVSGGNVTAAIPQAWIYQPGAGDLRFTARDPRHAGLSYSASLVGAGDLGRIVDTQIRARSSLLAEFQQLSRSDVSVGGRTGQAVTYAYVTARSGRPPVVYEARDLYIPTDSGVLVISLQSPMETFDDAVPAFEQFASSVRS